MNLVRWMLLLKKYSFRTAKVLAIGIAAGFLIPLSMTSLTQRIGMDAPLRHLCRYGLPALIITASVSKGLQILCGFYIDVSNIEAYEADIKECREVRRRIIETYGDDPGAQSYAASLDDVIAQYEAGIAAALGG